MSIPVQIDYRLPDNSVKLGYFFTVSYGCDTSDVKTLRKRVQWVLSDMRRDIVDGTLNEQTRELLLRDVWILTAVQFRKSGTEQWHDIQDVG